MADFDSPAFTWIPAANQVAFQYPGSTPADWFEAPVWTEQPTFALAMEAGAGGGGGGPAPPRGYPIGN